MDAYVKLFPTIFANDERFDRGQRNSVFRSTAFESYSSLADYAALTLCSQSKDNFMNLALAVNALKYVAWESYFESVTKDLAEKLNVPEDLAMKGINTIRSSQNHADVVTLSEGKATISLPAGDSFVVVADPENESLQPESDTANKGIRVELDGSCYFLSGKAIASEACLESRNRYFSWFRSDIIRSGYATFVYDRYRNARAEARDLASEFRANASAENLGKLLNKMAEMDKEARQNYIFDAIDTDMREVIDTAFSGTRWTFEYEPFEEGTVFVVWHDDDNPHTEARCSVFATTPEAKDRVNIPHARKLEEEDKIREFFEGSDKRGKLVSELPDFDGVITDPYEDIPWC